MAFSVNKGYSLQEAGSNPGTWGVGAPTALNEGVFNIIDNNLGGIVSKSVSSSDIPLSPTESQMAIVSLSGAQLANINVTTSCVGFFFVENLTTGNFNITVTNGVLGVVVPKGRSTVIADETNGCRIAGTDTFPTGTAMVFRGATAPTGWTKDLTINDAALRLSSTGGGTGGSTAFTSVFTPRTITKANIPNYNLNVSDPGHAHPTAHSNLGLNTTAGGGSVVWAAQGNSNTQDATTGISVNSGGSGTPMDFAVKYFDFCVAIKN